MQKEAGYFAQLFVLLELVLIFVVDIVYGAKFLGQELLFQIQSRAQIFQGWIMVAQLGVDVT